MWYNNILKLTICLDIYIVRNSYYKFNKIKSNKISALLFYKNMEICENLIIKELSLIKLTRKIKDKLNAGWRCSGKIIKNKQFGFYKQIMIK